MYPLLTETQKTHYNRPPLYSIELSEHIKSPCPVLFNVQFNIILPLIPSFPNRSLSLQVSWWKLYIHILSFSYMLLCPDDPNFLDLITLTIDKECKKWSSFIHSFHWHVQNATIPCHSQELLPFLSVTYFILPPFSTNYSSIISHLILPSISWSTSQFS